MKSAAASGLGTITAVPALALALALSGIAGHASAETAGAPPAAETKPSLEERFRDPPNAARPRVWWHWIGGNVDIEGARLDVAWMQRVGIGGFHAFSGELSMKAPQIVKRQPFMSEGWKVTLREAVRIAQPTGMEIGIAGSPGWSHTGGPWVPPEDGMKKYVWSETQVRGGRPFDGVLAPPPSLTGPIQSVPRSEPNKAIGPLPQHYRDSVVIAFPTPPATIGTPAPVLSASAPVDLARIASADLKGNVALPASPDAGAWLQAAYPVPVEVGAVTLGLPAGGMVEIQASNDGKTFRSLGTTRVETPRDLTHPLNRQTIAVAPTKARFFRVVLRPISQPSQLPMGPEPQAPSPPPAKTIPVSHVTFETGARVNRFEAKAGFQATVGDEDFPTPAGPGAIARNGVIDLTDKLRPDGRLEWTPPRGNWTVMRFGWSLTGRMNNPAEPEATGLEVDKYDPAAVRRYIDRYLAMYEEAVGRPMGPDSIQTLLTDSWEAGVQNWTPAMRKNFHERRGYDMTPFMPVLAGRVVGSAELSDRFLHDFRQTMKDMVADNHHKVIAEALHARGMTYYTEAQGDTPRAIADGMTLKARSDIPTAEYWYRPFAAGPGQYALKADLVEAASAAHVYGKPLAAAESLTVGALNDPWSFSPRMLKPVADEIFAHGINRFIYHESHHQPLVDKKPGLMLGLFGQFFNRNDTWAEDAKPWVDYLARTSQFLQEGRFVADVAYFYGEERNLTELFRKRENTDVPAGYRFDYINPEALLTLLSVKDGRVVTPSGMSYGVLYMPAHVTRYSLPALRKVRDLVVAGAVIVAPKPVGGVGVADSDAEVRRIAAEVWGEGAMQGRRFGKGMVFAAPDLGSVLMARGIAPDVAFTGASADSRILALHRRSDEADIYFVSNQQPRAEAVEASFRVARKAPELWRAETGKAEPLSYRLDGERVIVPLRLEPHEAAFVVFRRDAQAEQWTAPAQRTTELRTLSGPWPVSFEVGRGAPASATLERLISWPESADPGIRYFSGAGTYRKALQVPSGWLVPGRRVHLDLGDVKELAAISVNGRHIQTLWHAPFRVDLTDALRTGENRLEIKVVNLWPNRLIGDRQPGATAITFAPQAMYRADSPLMPSGLLGPVRVLAVDPAAP